MYTASGTCSTISHNWPASAARPRLAGDGNEFFRTITEETLDYVLREMPDPDGAFFSIQDADPTPLRSGNERSEGEEGKFIVWAPDEIRGLLRDEPEGFTAAYGVTHHCSVSTGQEHALRVG